MVRWIANAIFVLHVRWVLFFQHRRTRTLAPVLGQLWLGKGRTLIAICDVTPGSETKPQTVVFTHGIPERRQVVQSHEVVLSKWPNLVRSARLAHVGEWELDPL